MRYKRSLGNLLLCWYKKNEFRWFGCQSGLAKANNYISRFSSSSFRHFTVATARSSMTVLQAPIEARPPDFIIFLGSIQQKPRKGCLAFKKPSSFYFSEVANFADALRNLLLLLFKFVELRILRNVQASHSVIQPIIRKSGQRPLIKLICKLKQLLRRKIGGRIVIGYPVSEKKECRIVHRKGSSQEQF